MEQFKLKSIDELDLEFVNNSRGQKAQTNEPKSLIPEISKNEPVKRSDETIGAHYFTKPAQPLDEQPIYTPETQAPKKKARPLVPIGQTPSPYAPVGAIEEENLDFSDANYGEAKVDNEKKKSSKGVLAGKIISIVLLCATVVVFLLGCFVTIFLDNNGTDIGGMCFNTMGQDIEALEVSKGDLIISKKLEASEYTVGDLIAVPSSYFEGCDIQSISYVSAYSPDSAQITTTAMSGGVGYSNSVTSANCYGVVSSYIPALGGLLSFAMENAILVCILFVLLAAFWCLLLVLLEKSSSKASAKTKKEKVKKQKA